MQWVASAIAVFGCFLGFSSGYAHEHSDRMLPDVHLGKVSFDISCKPELQADVNRAVALLHSFWRNEAERTFEKVAAADPDCAIAYWGEALAEFPQVNGWPESSAVAASQRALARADTASERSPREATYIRA